MAMPPRPSPGVYVIVNRVLSPNDERLAITFNGPDRPATMTVRTDDPAQRVRVRHVTCTSYIDYIEVDHWGLRLQDPIRGSHERPEPSSRLGFRLCDGASSGKLCMDHQENRHRIHVSSASCFFYERDELTGLLVFKTVE
jgi:hypothetical protein